MQLTEERSACICVSGCAGQDGQHPNWARFQLRAAVGTVFTFEFDGHREQYKVTTHSAQAVFITAGMVLEDSAVQLEPEQEQPGAVVEPPLLKEFQSNMTLLKVGSLRWS